MHLLNSAFGAGWRFRTSRTVQVSDVADFRPERAGWFSRPVRVVLDGALVISRRYETGPLSRSKRTKLLRLKAEAFEENAGIALVHASSKPVDGIAHQAFVRKHVMDGILIKGEAAGLLIDRIEAQAPPALLTVFKHPGREAATWIWWCIGLLLLSFALSFALIMNSQVLEERKRQLTTMIASSTNLAQRAENVSGYAQQVDTSNAEVETLSAMFNRDALLLQRLADLTLALPRNTYVSSLEMTRETISGRFVSTGEVTAVLDDIGRLAWVATVQLSSPVTRDPSRQTQSFGLEIELNE